jgi:PLP dependent protein
MDIRENINSLKEELPAGVKLVAITKTKPIEDILQAYHAGHIIFGENKVQELNQKQGLLPSDIQWHMVGHLQSNKVKYIAPFVHLIHSVDSMKLLQTINREGIKNNRVIDCLLQVYIALEETKFGLSEEELYDIFKTDEFKSFTNVRICGLMGMATFTEDENVVRKEFRTLKGLFNKLKSSYFSEKSNFAELSMGMSGDYKIAVEEGSTMVRIGSLIFGERY